MPSLLSGYEEQRAPRTEEKQLKTQERTSDNTHDPVTLRLSNGDTCSTSCVTLRPQLLPPGDPNDNQRAQ